MYCETRENGNSQGFAFPICTDDKNQVMEEKCFQIFYIDKPGIEVTINNKQINAITPYLVCANHEDVINITNKKKVKRIYFHPYVINSILTYDNLIKKPNAVDEKITDDQDRFMLLPFTERNEHYQGIIELDAEAFTVAQRLFVNLKMELNGQFDFFWPCRSRSFLLELLILLNKCMYMQQQHEQHKETIVDLLLTYIHNNYTERITLDQLSSQFATNRTTLNQQFMKATGKSIIDYLIQLRMDLACTMLRDTTIPISEIKYRVGYNDSANFWKMFKKSVNMSPSEYRTQYCKILD